MEKKNKRSKIVYLIEYKILLIMILFNSFLVANTYADADANIIERRKINVRGTIIGIILTQTLKGPSFLIMQLDDGNKYRLKPEHGLGFIVGSDVELEITDTYKEDEISLLYKEMIYVNNINITAMAIPGTKKKVKYPPINPPEILTQAEEILKKIEQFRRKTQRKGTGSPIKRPSVKGKTSPRQERKVRDVVDPG